MLNAIENAVNCSQHFGNWDTEHRYVVFKENTCFNPNRRLHAKRFGFCQSKWLNHFIFFYVVVAKVASKDATISFPILIHARKWLFSILIYISNEFDLNASQTGRKRQKQQQQKQQKNCVKLANLAARQLRWMLPMLQTFHFANTKYNSDPFILNESNFFFKLSIIYCRLPSSKSWSLPPKFSNEIFGFFGELINSI